MAYSENEERKLVENLVEDCKTYNETINNLNEDSQLLNEAVWEKIKYGLSKLGRYKAGGKILGKSKTDAAAAAQIKAILEKKGNELIANLDKLIKEIDPEFPNNQHEEKFLQIIEEISKVYDSIVGAVQQNTMPVDAANLLIEDLATYVKKFLDVDLTAAYSTLDEEELYEEELLEAAPLAYQDPDPNHPKPSAPSAAPSVAPSTAPRNAGDVRAGLQAKTGSVTRDSERMKTLASNKLPLVLTAIGTALGGLGWLAQTDWMKDFIINWLGGGTPAEDAVYDTISGGKADSQGFVHWASQIMKKPITNGVGVQEFIDKFGIENVQNMFTDNGGGTVEEQGQKLIQLISGDNANKSVGELFNERTFGDMKMGRNLFGISKAGSFVARTIVKQAVKATAGAGVGVAAGVAGVGAVLVPLGIGLISAGALVKLMRMKGQRQSRAKTLNDLFQSLQPINGTAENPVFLDTNGDGKTDSGTVANIGGKTTRKPINSNSLQVYIKRLFDVMNKFETPAQPAQPAKKPAVNYNYNTTEPKKGVGYPSSVNAPTWTNESLELDEGAYLRDKSVYEVLAQKLGADNVKKFEAFLTKLATVKNATKRMPKSGIADVDAKVEKVKSSPLMNANFRTLCNAATDDQHSMLALEKFISGVLKAVSSSKYKYSKIINAIKENEGLGEVKKPVNFADAMTRDKFVQYLTPFLGDVAALYQALNTANKQNNPEQNISESVKRINEDAERMRQLMKFNLNTKRVI